MNARMILGCVSSSASSCVGLKQTMTKSLNLFRQDSSHSTLTTSPGPRKSSDYCWHVIYHLAGLEARGAPCTLQNQVRKMDLIKHRCSFVQAVRQCCSPSVFYKCTCSVRRSILSLSSSNIT